MKNAFEGTYTALITPFRNGALDLPALQALVERQIAGGVDGLVPCGTTGEAPTLAPLEYEQVVRCVVDTAAGRVPIVAGAGTNCTAKTIELSQHCAEWGVDGLLLVAPYYNKPPQRGLYAHFAAVADAVKLPIVLYNIPGRCGVEMSIETIARLRAEHTNIVAIKHATGSAAGAADIAAASDIAVLSGDDPLTLPLMSVGAVGVISVVSNLLPAEVKRVTQAALAGDFAAARAANAALQPLARAMLSLDTNPIPIKTALALKGWCAEEFRLPLCPLEAGKRAELERLLGNAAK